MIQFCPVSKTYYFFPLEKEMATHSNTLAWKIPRTKEPGRLQSMGLERVMTEQLNCTELSCFSKPTVSVNWFRMTNDYSE